MIFLISTQRRCNGVKLLVLGTVETGGSGCVCPEHVMLKRIINHLMLRSRRCGHSGYGGRSGASGQRYRRAAWMQFIVVIEPGARSVQTYKNVKRLATGSGRPPGDA